MVTKKASDLYLTFDSAPALRIEDDIIPVVETPLTQADLDRYLDQLMERGVEPRRELRPLYDRLYGRYRELHLATREIQHELADLQHDA